MALFTRFRIYSIVSLGMLLLLIPTLAWSQAVKEEDLPSEVMVSFRKSFPVIAVDGYLTRQGDYQLSFRADGADRVYLYTEKGKLLVMRMVIEEYVIPGEIRESMGNLGEASLVKAFKVKTASGNYYEILMKEKERLTLYRYNTANVRISANSMLPGEPFPRL